MCFLASLPREFQKYRDSVQIAIVTETLLYLSQFRKAEISGDVVIENRTDKTVPLLLTHPDDVEGRLATEDWFHEPFPNKGDRRRNLVSQIYGKHWDVDAKERTLRFANPMGKPVGSTTLDDRLRACALSYRKPDQTAPGDPFNVDPAYLELNTPNSEAYGTYLMKKLPEVTGISSHRPFSTFCLSIPPRQVVFARLTVIVEGEAYNRLVCGGNSREPDTFTVVGSGHILQRLNDEVDSDRWAGKTGDRYRGFLKDVQAGTIVPEAYQIIIGQPGDSTGNKLVHFLPTSSSIRELYIPNDEARNCALWFDTDSNDFRVVLQYKEPPAGHRLSRKEFYKRLAPSFAYRIPDAEL